VALSLPVLWTLSLASGQFYGIPPGWRSGTEANIPVACNKGERYWATDSTPGMNSFACTTTGDPGTWTRDIPSGGGTPGYEPNQPLTGCGLEYISLLNFQLGICTYTINGITYTSPLTPITLGASDPTNPRIDLIGVDNTGVVFVTAGTPAASPALPTSDPATQLGLYFVNVAAGATTPTGISLVDIYEENTEWTSAVTANFNAASASNPYRGTTDIEATSAVLTNSVTLTKPAAGTENLQNWNTLIFYVRSKAAWPTGNGSNAARVVNIFWLSGATQIGVPVVLRDGVFGFSSATLGVYQQVSIPLSLFGTGSNTVTTLKFQISGNAGSTSIGFFLDAITLQGGTGSIVLPVTLMNFKGPWSSSTAYVPNDTVVGGGIGYVALLANTNVAVGTASTWTPLAGSGNASISRGAFASVPACSTSQFAYLATDWPGTFHCDGASSGQWLLAGVGAVTPAANFPWTGWINQTSATVVASQGSIILTGTASGGQNMQARYVAVPATPYSVTACFTSLSGEASYSQAGMFVSDGTAATNKLIFWGSIGQVTAGSPGALEVGKWTNFTTFSADYATLLPLAASGTGSRNCFTISDDGTTRKFWYAPTGFSRVLYYSGTHTDFLTPTHVGIVVNSNTSNKIPTGVFDAFTSVAETL